MARVATGACLAVVAATLPLEAHAYDWIGSKHGCVVEQAMYTRTQSSTAGRWTNAPNTIFVDVRTCAEFARSRGLRAGAEPAPGAMYPELMDQARLNRCAEVVEDLDHGLIVQTERLMGELLAEPDFYPKKVVDLENNFPFVETFRGVVLRLHPDGTADASLPRFLTDDAAPVWFTLRALCSPLEG